MDKTAIWKKTDENPDYEVSNLGEIRRTTFFPRAGAKTKVSKQYFTGCGYLMVGLRGNPERGEQPRILRFVHGLVAKAFVPGFAEGLQVNHKDGCKTNNLPENLDWFTPSQNHRHAWAHRAARKKVRQITDEEIALMRLCAEFGLTGAQICRAFELNHDYVSRVLNGLRRKIPPQFTQA